MGRYQEGAVELSLYSWFGSQYIDSYYPSSIACIRALNKLEQDFKVQYLILPEQGNAVDKVLSNFPVLQVKEDSGESKTIHKGGNIMDFLLEQVESSIDPKEDPGFRKNTMTEQWARESLSKTMTYFLFHNADNFEVFKNALVRRFSSGIMTDDKVTAIRDAMVNSMGFSDLKTAEYAKARDLLFTQFQIVDDMISRSSYASGEELKTLDIWLFSYCSLLLLPYNQEAEHLKKEFPKVREYLLKIHEETKGEFTGSCDFLKVG